MSEESNADRADREAKENASGKTYRISYRPNERGTGTKHEYLSEKQVEQRIEKQTDKKTGEVKGVHEIKEVGNDSNKVERKPKGWLW